MRATLWQAKIGPFWALAVHDASSSWLGVRHPMDSAFILRANCGGTGQDLCAYRRTQSKLDFEMDRQLNRAKAQVFQLADALGRNHSQLHLACNMGLCGYETVAARDRELRQEHPDPNASHDQGGKTSTPAMTGLRLNVPPVSCRRKKRKCARPSLFTTDDNRPSNVV